MSHTDESMDQIHTDQTTDRNEGLLLDICGAIKRRLRQSTAPECEDHAAVERRVGEAGASCARTSAMLTQRQPTARTLAGNAQRVPADHEPFARCPKEEKGRCRRCAGKTAATQAESEDADAHLLPHRTSQRRRRSKPKLQLWLPSVSSTRRQAFTPSSALARLLLRSPRWRSLAVRTRPSPSPTSTSTTRLCRRPKFVSIQRS